MVPGQVRAAVWIIAIETLAMLAAAIVNLVFAMTETSHSVAGALGLAALALLVALVLATGARGLMRLRPAARTPVIVVQLLALPVSYSIAFQAGLVAYGGPILVAALVTIYLLFTPPAREALDHRRD